MNVIHPFSKHEQIKAGFTLVDESYQHPRGKVKGYNLGLNTPDEREVVLDNRKKVFNGLELDINQAVFCNQVHGNHIAEVQKPQLVSETDGLITTKKGLILNILVADCSALLLYDSEINAIAALHAGWRGAQKRILEKCLNLFRSKGSTLKNSWLYISPCISEKHFEVGEDVASLFPDSVVNRKDYAKPHINLKTFLKHQAVENGIPASQIIVDQQCTFSDSTSFYSYRRDGKKSGRMMGYIQLL